MMIVVAEADPRWAEQFRVIGGVLRDELGALAQRIDHIGSTSVPGLAAKPVIDVQIAVASFEPFDDLRAGVEAAGFTWRADNPDRNKRFFSGELREDVDGVRPRANVHMRWAGSFSEQCQLLFRDYLRVHPDACDRYAARKRELVEQPWDDVNDYAAAKTDVIWAITYDAYQWEQATGYRPGPSDA